MTHHSRHLHRLTVFQLLTKAYTLFKKDGATQNRTSLFVAFRMAEIHCEAGQYDLALKWVYSISQFTCLIFDQ